MLLIGLGLSCSCCEFKVTWNEIKIVVSFGNNDEEHGAQISQCDRELEFNLIANLSPTEESGRERPLRGQNGGKVLYGASLMAEYAQLLD